MYQIFEFKFKLKSDADGKEIMRLFEEVAFPILRKVPGLVSVYVLKYTATGVSGGIPEWDYAWFEVWESEEAQKKAVSDKYIFDSDSQLGKTGFYEKAFAIIEKWQSSWGTLIASTE